MEERLGSGEICAFRLSSTKRYTQDFTPPAVLEKDAQTELLLDFSAGKGETVADLSGNRHHGAIQDATWIPWTYDRLSMWSGYGAGVHSPGWYLGTSPTWRTGKRSVRYWPGGRREGS